MKASRRLIENRAFVAVELATEGSREISGMCDPVSIEFCHLLQRLDYEIIGLGSMHFLGDHPHYVAVIPGEITEFTSADRVIVDPTIQQFEHETDIELPEVAIVPSTDERWDEWYPEMELVDDYRL